MLHSHEGSCLPRSRSWNAESLCNSAQNISVGKRCHGVHCSEMPKRFVFDASHVTFCKLNWLFLLLTLDWLPVPLVCRLRLLELWKESKKRRVNNTAKKQFIQINRPFHSFELSCLVSEWKWGWRWPCFDRNLHAFFYVNDAVLMLISSNLHNKRSEVSIITRLPPASLSFKGRVTRHTTVKRSIDQLTDLLKPGKRVKRYQTTLIGKDHLGDWSPELECCWWLTFRPPVRKPSSESSDSFSQSWLKLSTVLLRTPITQMTFFNQGILFVGQTIFLFTN